ITSTAGAITQVVFECTAEGDAQYGPGCFTANPGEYSYSGKVLKQLRQHTDNANSFNETYTYAYDHSDRVTSVRYKLGQRDEITLVSYTYDELGRIKQKKSYDKNLGVTNYAYNIQDQITVIDANYYDKHYHYADLSESGHKALYNGDISSCVTLAGKNVIDSVRYTYDELDRITAETGMTGPDGSLSATWNYDKHSNITGLRRTDKNGVQIDDLDITYTGNQINEVFDHGTHADSYNTMEYQDKSDDLQEYGNFLMGVSPYLKMAAVPNEHEYDANGNMTVDLDRKIVATKYNLLNLPDTIQYFDGSMTVNRYLADGTKVSSIQYTPKATTMVPIGKVCDVESLGEVRLSGTAYCGNIDYDVLSDGSLTARRVRNSEGYITNLKNQTSSPAHYTRDIQGNVISVLSMSDGYPYQGSIYYADGLLKSKSFSNSFQPYLYSGKELLKMHGYDCYDYGARHSYTALGRFTTIDPLAENDPGTSPYVLCKGNPVKFIDPDGRWPWENRNIRDARAFASQNGYDVQLTDGKYGKDAVVVKDGNVVTTYSARLSEQKTWYDNLDDHH
ncbi:MAG: hypothetical protein J6P67_05345, partial [Bacteroidaceae bacterium]|nr:hypothetical protein [Bacteroidaceae bacterium]